MNKRKRLLALSAAFLLYSAAIAGIFYYMGSHKRPLWDAADAFPTQTFYATIEEIQGSVLTVKGSERNDVNHRGAFSFAVAEDTALTWRGTAIERTDLRVDQTISITYSGGVRESDPGQLVQVVSIQLLDDEK